MSTSAHRNAIFVWRASQVAVEHVPHICRISLYPCCAQCACMSCVCACMRACACMSSWERVCVPCMHVYINANTYFWILSWVLVTKTNTVLISVFRESLSDECQSRVQSASRPSGAWGQATSHPPCAEATQFHLPILSFVRGKGRL